VIEEDGLNFTPSEIRKSLRNWAKRYDNKNEKPISWINFQLLLFSAL